MKQFAIGTRYWNSKNGSGHDKIIAFITTALGLAKTVIVAINAKEDKNNTAEYLTGLNQPGLIVVRVQPWGFTFAMNVLVFQAAALKQEYLLSVSTEVVLSQSTVTALFAHMDNDTLCVGAAMEGHDFKPGTHTADGLTIPWNTCKLLNLTYYGDFGFPLIGDAAFDATQSGVEELSADSLIQNTVKTSTGVELGVKLVAVNDMQWKTDFDGDEDRLKNHESKMASKIQRPQAQLRRLRIPPAEVLHISA